MYKYIYIYIHIYIYIFICSQGKAASAVNKNIGPLKKQTKMFASSKSTAAPSASGDIQPKPKYDLHSTILTCLHLH